LISAACAAGAARGRFGIQVAILLSREGKRKVLGIMKFEVPLLAGLVFLGTQLLARAQIQGFEGALLSGGVECALRGLRAASTRLRTTMAHRTR
jgi:hypothetical protein